MTESYEELLAKNEELRRSLEESQELLRAIKSGEINAFVLSGSGGEQVYTLEGADRAYRVLIEAMNEGAVTLTSDGTILYCNLHFARMVKSSLEKVIGSSIYDFIPNDDQAAFRVLQNDLGRGELKLTIKGEDEGLLPVYISFNALQISESQEDFCVVFTDLTEQKHNDEIVASEKLARSIIEQATEAIVVCNTKGKIIRFSNAVSRILGCDPSLKSFEDLFDMHLPGGGKLSPVSNALHGEVLLNVEASLERCDDGVPFYLLLNAGPLKGANGKIIGCVVTLTDITERKRMEEELQRNEEKYRAAIDFTCDWETWLSPEGNYIYVSPSCKRITGYSAEKFLTDPEFIERIVHPDDRKLFPRHLNNVDDAQPVDFRIITCKGEERWISHICQPVFSSEGRYLGRRASNRDITDLKRSEEALRETRDYLENMINYANAPIIVWDTSFNITRFNHAFERLTGLEVQDVLSKPLDILFPDDSKEESLALIKRTSSGERWDAVEIPILRTDGSVRTVLWNSANIYDKGRTAVVATIAQGQDITDRKQAEKALNDAVVKAERDRSQLEAMFAAQNDAVLIYDAEMNIQRVNASFIDTYGFDPVGLNLKDLTQRVSCRWLDGRPFLLDEQPTPRALRGEKVTGQCFMVTPG